jgi:hypothetical protein
MTNEMITLRMNILGGMNSYLLNNVTNEEVIIDDWWAVGVPDMPTEEDLRTIAEDEELWLDAVNSFARCAKYVDLI